MRPLLLLALLALLALPAPSAATPDRPGEPKDGLAAPEPGCEAPPFVSAGVPRRVWDEAQPAPFRHAMLACARHPDEAPKPRLRLT